MRHAMQVYNLTTGAQHDLAGHQDEVFALAAANGLLLSGGKDMSIRVWKHDSVSGSFQPSVRHLTSSKLPASPNHQLGQSIPFNGYQCQVQK